MSAEEPSCCTMLLQESGAEGGRKAIKGVTVRENRERDMGGENGCRATERKERRKKVKEERDEVQAEEEEEEGGSAGFDECTAIYSWLSSAWVCACMWELWLWVICETDWPNGLCVEPSARRGSEIQAFLNTTHRANHWNSETTSNILALLFLSFSFSLFHVFCVFYFFAKLACILYLNSSKLRCLAKVFMLL